MMREKCRQFLRGALNRWMKNKEFPDSRISFSTNKDLNTIEVQVERNNRFSVEVTTTDDINLAPIPQRLGVVTTEKLLAKIDDDL